MQIPHRMSDEKCFGKHFWYVLHASIAQYSYEAALTRLSSKHYESITRCAQSAGCFTLQLSSPCVIEDQARRYANRDLVPDLDHQWTARAHACLSKKKAASAQEHVCVHARLLNHTLAIITLGCWKKLLLPGKLRFKLRLKLKPGLSIIRILPQCVCALQFVEARPHCTAQCYVHGTCDRRDLRTYIT